MNRTDTQKTPKEPSRADLEKRKARLHRIVGAGIRLVFFAAMPSAFATGFSGVKYLMTSIGKGEALTMNSFVWTLIGLLIFTFVFGRFFCGYVCAFGTLGDAVYSVSAWIQKKVFHRKKPLTIPQRAQRPLQKVKYLVLAVLVLMCAFGSYSLLTGWSPWDVFSRLTAFQSPAAGYIGGAVLLAVIVIGMAFQPRFFCQFLCPMGALFSLMPILPFSAVKSHPEHCIKGCQNCRKNCPVGIKPGEDKFLDGECVACEKCMYACPKENISRPTQKIIRIDWLSLILKAALFFVMGVFLGLCRFF